MEAEKDHYYILDEITQYARDITDKYGLKKSGSYNPYELGISDSDFYDSRHVRRELMGKYFDFLE